MDKVRTQLAGISALVDFWWQTVRQDLTQMAMTSRWTTWAEDWLLPLMYWQQQHARTRCPVQKAQIALVLQAVEESFARHSCTRQLKPEVLAGWKAWAADHAKAFQRASSAVEGRSGSLSQMQHNHRGLPRVATRCGRLCTISIVGPRTGRHRRCDFSNRFPICLRACCHRSTSCLCPGSVVRPSRQVIEGAGCPGLDRCPKLEK